MLNYILEFLAVTHQLSMMSFYNLSLSLTLKRDPQTKSGSQKGTDTSMTIPW